MNNRRLTWRHLKALNDLYERGQTTAAIFDNAFIGNLKKQKRLIGLKPGSDKLIVSHPGYKEYYECHFKEPFEAYLEFLVKNDIDSSARNRFDEYDLEAFVFIVANKEEIRRDLTTIRHFSSLFFRTKGSKYLEMHPGIARVVCKLLEIDSFPGQDPKSNAWRFVVDHPSPKLVILCENLANLKRPWVALEHGWELWYVGGNNIAIVEQVGKDKLQLPIYYSCDWDLAGLEIYGRLRQILSGKGCPLHLLEPHDKEALMDIESPEHGSRWKRDVPYSGLDTDVFTSRQLAIVTILIEGEKWIEEESQDLVKMMEFNSHF
jgi:hypothetical protein